MMRVASASRLEKCVALIAVSLAARALHAKLFFSIITLIAARIAAYYLKDVGA